MKRLLITLALALLVTGPKRAHTEVQKNSSSSLSCPSCTKARNEGKEKRNAEGKIDEPLVSDLSEQQHLLPPLSWKDLKEEWDRPLSPAVSEEEMSKRNYSNGLLCPSCNLLGAQRVCKEEFKWCVRQNKSCLTLHGNTKMGESYYDIIVKRCATEEDCRGEIKTLYGFPFEIKEKVCVNAKPTFQSKGSVLFSFPALLVILPWMLLFIQPASVLLNHRM